MDLFYSNTWTSKLRGKTLKAFRFKGKQITYIERHESD